MGMYERGTITHPEKKKGLHPIWRGIGCLLMVLIVVMSYAGALLLVDANKIHRWAPVAKEIRGGPNWGVWAADLYAELVVAFLLAVIGFGLFVIGYSIIYKVSFPKDKTDY